ncbi:uncharacterized protein BXZ73DRAFT_100223 [Epithele typhae]|uniref:uncharacterized protein n=1 Tax=Epithele typhae TaxID=378194 RepID=UPI0020077749|nr:uncharacterized protein BXZ73DRAFT_100223 [Epithele typhae]KAH9936800.1 hypothetical protein BXZ73DRAFT_100223 [Epithele typhae]
MEDSKLNTAKRLVIMRLWRHDERELSFARRACSHAPNAASPTTSPSTPTATPAPTWAAFRLPLALAFDVAFAHPTLAPIVDSVESAVAVAPSAPAVSLKPPRQTSPPPASAATSSTTAASLASTLTPRTGPTTTVASRLNFAPPL